MLQNHDIFESGISPGATTIHHLHENSNEPGRRESKHSVGELSECSKIRPTSGGGGDQDKYKTTPFVIRVRSPSMRTHLSEEHLANTPSVLIGVK